MARRYISKHILEDQQQFLKLIDEFEMDIFNLKDIESFIEYEFSNLNEIMENLVEKGDTCCHSCDISKITYFEMCSVCQDEDYVIIASVWCKLLCGHIFHKHCVLQIKCHAGTRFKCPLCRHDQPQSAIEVI